MSSRLDNYLHLLANFFEAHTVALVLREARERLVVSHYCTLSDALMPGAAIAPGQGILGWIYREGKTVHVTRFDRDTRTLGIYQRDVGIKALLAAPLPGGEGVLMIDSKSRYAFTEKRQKIFRNCPGIAASLLELEHQKAELQGLKSFYALQSQLALSHLPPLHVIAAHLEAEGALSACLPKGSDQYRVTDALGQWRSPSVLGRSFSVSEGLVGWCFRYRRHLRLRKPLSPRQFLLYKGERVQKSGRLVIIHVEEDGWSNVMAFNGDFDLSSYPKGFEAILALAAKGAGQGGFVCS